MKNSPNILLITSDQQRADCNGFENSDIRTPHIDALAREGTRFSACITPNLVCQPSRASILTGQLPLTHGVWDNGVDLEPGVGERGFAGAFSRAGYDTAFLGGDRAIDWLKSRAKSRPFCACVSFPDPHHAFDCPEPWSLMYEPKSVTQSRSVSQGAHALRRPAARDAGPRADRASPQGAWSPSPFRRSILRRPSVISPALRRKTTCRAAASCRCLKPQT